MTVWRWVLALESAFHRKMCSVLSGTFTLENVESSHDFQIPPSPADHGVLGKSESDKEVGIRGGGGLAQACQFCSCNPHLGMFFCTYSVFPVSAGQLLSVWQLQLHSSFLALWSWGWLWRCIGRTIQLQWVPIHNSEDLAMSITKSFVVLLTQKTQGHKAFVTSPPKLPPPPPRLDTKKTKSKDLWATAPQKWHNSPNVPLPTDLPSRSRATRTWPLWPISACSFFRPMLPEYKKCHQTTCSTEARTATRADCVPRTFLASTRKSSEQQAGGVLDKSGFIWHVKMDVFVQIYFRFHNLLWSSVWVQQWQVSASKLGLWWNGRLRWQHRRKRLR